MENDFIYTVSGITTLPFPAINNSTNYYSGYDYRDAQINELKEMIRDLQTQIDQLKPRESSSINLDETTRKLPLPLE
jgi:hypothetical protein